MVSYYNDPRKYAYRVEKYPNYIVIKKERFFWVSRWVYAKVLHELLWYKLIMKWWDLYTWGPNLDNIREKLDEYNLSYICVNGDDTIYCSQWLSDENLKIINELKDKDVEIQLWKNHWKTKIERKWTEAEDKILKHLFDEKNYTIEELANLFITSEICIISRLKELLLIDDWVDNWVDDWVNGISGKIIDVKNEKERVSFNLTFEEILLSELKKTRTKISKEKNIEPKLVCYDNSLAEMIKLQPISRTEMIKISWIKDVKFEKFWEEFIQTIKYVLSLYDKHWFNKDWIHKNGTFFDKYWFNKEWIHKDTWEKCDMRWFDIEHINKETWTEYDKNWLDINWEIDPIEKAKKEKARNDEIRRLLG